MLLIYLTLAWLVGVVLADSFTVSFLWWGILSIIGVGGALIGGRGRVRLAALCAAALALGGARYELARIPTTPRSIWQLAKQSGVMVQGVVSSDPQRADDGQQVVLDVEAVRGTESSGKSGVRPAEGLLQVKLPPYPAYTYGQRLLVRGDLVTPPEPKRPGEFDYRAYLARKGIFVLMQKPTARLMSGNSGNWLLQTLLAFRSQCQAVLLRSLPEPESSLAVGILLGLQSSIPDDVYNTFSVTGTSHILVISGWNISIIASALYAVANRAKLSPRVAFWAILGTIWLYTLFVGATPTVIRAAVMGTIVVVGQRLERRAHAWTTLLVACWAMTVWNPQTLWDLGFQLSALATASLFAFGKGTEALLVRTPLRVSWLGWAREALTATLAAQILALPLILYTFGNLSIIAPLANVVLLPVVPYTMLVSTIALVGGLVWLPLGQGLSLVAYLFLAWLTEGARIFAGLPWAAVQIPPFPLWVLLGYYAIVVSGWLWSQWQGVKDETIHSTLGTLAANAAQ